MTVLIIQFALTVGQQHGNQTFAEWYENYNAITLKFLNEQVEAEWIFNVNITQENEDAMVR